ncbi:hypothetical protein Tco_0046794 [Tanacetum coccineum]
MTCLKALQSHFTSLSDNLKDDAPVATFKRTFSQDMDLLEKQLTKEILHETDCKTSLTELRSLFENTFNSYLRPRLQNYTAFETIFVRDTIIDDMDLIKKYMIETILHQQEIQQFQITDKYFIEYTGIEVKQFKEILLQHMSNVKKSVAERTCHKKQYDRRVNKRQMQTQESKVDAGKALDVDLVDTESIRTDSTVQDESSNSRNGIDVDDADIRLIYDEEPMVEVQLNAECNIFAIGQQNTEQPEIIHEGQHGQILNETSNIAKIKKEINVLETMNIELEHSMAKLLKENKNLKQHYKDLYDSIKISRSKTIEQTTSLLANNSDLKAQIQEKHYLPKRRESAFAKPDQVIASSESKNSSKNLPRFSSNDMVHNYYQEEARKKTQERNRNSKSSVMHTTSPQNTTKGHRFSLNKTSDVYKKTSPRSDLRWKPMGRIFKTIGLRWIPTGKILASCTSKDESEPAHGSNVDILNIHECKQTLDLSAGTSLTGQQKQRIDFSADAPVTRTASTAVKPYQEDSCEFYLITGSIYTDYRGTVVIETIFDEVTKTLSSISVVYH